MLLVFWVFEINLLGTFGYPRSTWLRLAYMPSGAWGVRIGMAQDFIDVQEAQSEALESPLVVCKGCGKLVPRTNLCLYCGSPILYGKHAS